MATPSPRWRTLLGCALIAGSVCGVARANSGAAAARAASIPAHYHLTTTDGHDVTEASFTGRWQLVFFGFTSCPDICSTAMLSVKVALAALGPTAARIQPIFITLDPQRDTPEKLAEYLRFFGPTLVGLRGSDAQVHAAAQAFRVYVKARALGADSYTVDHSAFLYLLDPQGRFVQLLAGDSPGHRLADDLRAALQ
jgi:protein SCO1